MIRCCAVLQFGIVVAALAIGFPARAQVHFTTPVLPFEQALAAANTAGKPLVVEFSATWCGPCKLLSRQLAKPRAKPAVDLVYLVSYDGDGDETGSALMNKLGYNSFPTLVAFDAEGKEVSNQIGYASWSTIEQWLKELPEQSVPLPTLLKSADASPRDGKLQLRAALRLSGANRPAEARAYYGRASKSADSEAAATAAWALLQLDAQTQQQRTARHLAEQLVAQHPGTKEAGRALRFLASLQTTDAAPLERLFQKHLEQLKDPADMNSLAYAAMKARAFSAAVKIAEKLAPLAAKDASYQDTLAEVAFYAERKHDKAVLLEQRAVDMASGSQRDEYAANLERFRRNQNEPCDELLNFDAPTLSPEHTTRHGSSPKPAWRQALSTLSRQLRDSCWQQAQALLAPIEVIIIASAKAAEHRAIFPVGTPQQWSSCVLKLIRTTELPDGKVLTLEPSIVPPSWDEQLDTVTANAEDGCRAPAGDSPRSLHVALSGEAGRPVTVTFPHGNATSPELRTCIEKAFSSLTPPRPLLQTQLLRFGDD